MADWARSEFGPRPHFPTLVVTGLVSARRPRFWRPDDGYDDKCNLRLSNSEFQVGRRLGRRVLYRSPPIISWTIYKKNALFSTN